MGNQMAKKDLSREQLSHSQQYRLGKYNPKLLLGKMSQQHDWASDYSTCRPWISPICVGRRIRWQLTSQFTVGHLTGAVDNAVVGSRRSQVHNTRHTIPQGALDIKEWFTTRARPLTSQADSLFDRIQYYPQIFLDPWSHTWSPHYLPHDPSAPARSLKLL